MTRHDTRKLPGRLASLALCLVLAPVASAAASDAATHRNSNGICVKMLVPVRLAAGGALDNHLAATVCLPRTWARGQHQADIMIHGATYNRSCWDFPTSDPDYSYVRRTLGSGRAAVFFDQLGVGASSHPVSAAVTLDVAAYTVHQLVGWVHLVGVSSVTLVGHSMGSFTAIREAAAYHDVTRLVLTGALHTPANIPLTALYPANLDPRFNGLGLDDGYATTVPGIRGSIFYDLATADPAVIAQDEASKDVVAFTFVGGVIGDTATPAAFNVSTQVRVPVLLVLGEQDNLFCTSGAVTCTPAGITAYEQPYFPAAPSLAVVTIPATGHDLTLHPSAGTSFAAIDAWIRSN